MILRINGKDENIDAEDLTIAKLLKVNNVPDPDMVSVQLNGEILEHEAFASTKVNDNDQLEFLYFMGGG